MKLRISQLFFLLIAFSPVFFVSLGLVGSQILMNSSLIQAEETVLTLGASAPDKIDYAPSRLIIPTIKVNASIQSVGFEEGGEMGGPDSPLDVGWLDLNSLSGSVGSAVISGHLNQENGSDGVFANLLRLRLGDEVFVQDNNGGFTTFIVKESRLYDPGYAEEIFNPKNGINLNLVTCDGTWDKKTKSYNKRLVVTAQLVP